MVLNMAYGAVGASLKSLERMRRLKLGLPIEKRGLAPTGYQDDPNNPKQQIPIDHVFLKLAEAYKYYKQRALSLRTAAEWVTFETDYYMSHEGIRAVFEKRAPDPIVLDYPNLEDRIAKWMNPSYQG